jgi:CarD family transcriptional regulator
MSSVKKVGKSRKTKVVAARSAAKSRRAGVKTAKRQTQPKTGKARSASMPRTGQSSAKAAVKRTGSAKAKTAHKPTRGAAASTAATRARASSLARLKKAARPASAAHKPASSAKERAKAASRLARAKQTAPRGKPQPGKTVAQPKLPKATTVAPRQPAPRNEATAQKALSERRAQAAAVMALRATASKPVPQTRGSAGVTQKNQKKAAAATPQPARPSAPLPPRTPPAATTVAPQAPVEPKPEIRAPERPGFRPAPRPPGGVKLGFKPAEFIVYPSHGVGQILAIEEQEVAGFKLELFVISFAKDKMILKVPTPKTVSVGMRKLAGADVVKQALNTLTGRARIKRTMWSRRAQEYEAKINSGDLVAIAEVVRDLYRSEAQPEQSYSERQLYEAALDRVARELAVVQKLTETESLKLIDSQLQKGPRRTKADEAEAEAAVGESDEGVEEAA